MHTPLLSSCFSPASYFQQFLVLEIFKAHKRGVTLWTFKANIKLRSILDTNKTGTCKNFIRAGTLEVAGEFSLRLSETCHGCSIRSSLSICDKVTVTYLLIIKRHTVTQA